MRHIKDILNTMITHSPLLKIIDSINGRTIDNITIKRPRPLTFNVFIKDKNGLINNS